MGGRDASEGHLARGTSFFLILCFERTILLIFMYLREVDICLLKVLWGYGGMMFVEFGIGLPRCEVSRHFGMGREHHCEVYR